eukprot:487675-Pleurochrysis_carterae.AAC.1
MSAGSHPSCSCRHDRETQVKGSNESGNARHLASGLFERSGPSECEKTKGAAARGCVPSCWLVRCSAVRM